MKKARTHRGKRNAKIHSVSIGWKCPECGDDRVTTTYGGDMLTTNGGGCTGHNDGSYCYCPRAAVVVTLECPECHAVYEEEPW